MNSVENDVKNCFDTLLNGGTILYPTDTIWGIGCDATNEKAIEKVYNLKKRPQNKSFIVLLAEAKDILKYIATPHPDIIDIVENFKQPTTVIYNNAIDLPEALVHESGTIAIRVTTDPFCKALIKRLKKPIVSTSANISGAPSPQIFKDVASEIINGVDYVVKHRQDDDNAAPPSQIIQIDEHDGSIKIIRA
ncbi:MAG: L-threonylcarbamoyladenylate synthase [Flavipsychrobacter sp.]